MATDQKVLPVQGEMHSVMIRLANGQLLWQRNGAMLGEAGLPADCLDAYLNRVEYMAQVFLKLLYDPAL